MVKMKGWPMIHKIKDYKNSSMSQTATADELGMAWRTVNKYWEMSEEEIINYLKNRERKKELDDFKDYILYLLEKYSKMKVPKIRRKLKEKGIEIKVTDRSLRRYVKRLKDNYPVKQKRYYAPIVDSVPGAQGQVDLGELRGVKIDGKPRTVYFSAMVLSHSRMLYVSWSLKSFKTEDFIRFHEEAFRYFQGVPEEIVYDQTKLVVIEEKYREIYFNDRFYQYATGAGFSPWICRAYDPESKGRIEAAVKYIKNDFLYGEEFSSLEELVKCSHKWLEETANVRIHGTTGQRPCDMFLKEQPYLKTYRKVIVAREENQELRNVDKTSLISYEGNKYSVPQKYQEHTVVVEESLEGCLIVRDKRTQAVVANHIISQEKGKIFKNPNHYRDFSKSLREVEQEVEAIIPVELAQKTCKNLKKNNPKIYRDQLVGLKRVYKNYPHEVMVEVLTYLQDKEYSLRVTLIEEFIKAKVNKKELIEIQNIEEISRFKSLTSPNTSQHKLSIFEQIGGAKI